MSPERLAEYGLRVLTPLEFGRHTAIVIECRRRFRYGLPILRSRR